MLLKIKIELRSVISKLQFMHHRNLMGELLGVYIPQLLSNCDLIPLSVPRVSISGSLTMGSVFISIRCSIPDQIITMMVVENSESIEELVTERLLIYASENIITIDGLLFRDVTVSSIE